ncbi:MAG: hypothetical protein LR015_11010 [Verrucomicrobia bacterium]|nr:hypothetical protein [Verrucomicrobiota bacterium]
MTSYLLRNVVAPVQQSFYYTQPSLSADEKWLWLMVAWPPSPSRSLAAVSLDPCNPVIHHFPQAQFPTALPLIAPDGGVWFGSGASIYKMTLDGETTKVFTLPDRFIAGRRLDRLATHLSLSSNRQFLLLDGAIGAGWFVGTAHLATGEFHLIREFDTHHNHALFSPTDSTLFTIARDKQCHPVSGKFSHHNKRTFLMDTANTRYHCVNEQFKCAPFRGACHEWWSADGHICYIDYETGAYEYDIHSGLTQHIWQEPLCHAHCSSNRRFWCADESPYKWREQPCKVLLFDRLTGQRFEVQSGMPMPDGDYWATRNTYHIDPHPQISPRDNYIVYTATSETRITVALAEIEHIVQKSCTY